MYAAILIGIIFTIKDYKKWVSGQYYIPKLFFFKGKFLAHLSSMIILVLLFSNAHPLDDTLNILIISIGIILGAINGVFNTMMPLEEAKVGLSSQVK